MTTENQDIQHPEITDAPEAETVEVEVEADGEETPPPPQAEEPPEKKPFDPKKDKVEFTTPEQQARFNEVFRDRKKADQRNQMLTDLLQEQMKIIEEIRTERNQVKEADAEKVLMQKVRAARDAGDDDAYDQALSALIDFRTEKRAEKIVDQKVNGLLQKSAADESKQAQYVTSLMEETDESGNYVRPWLQESHPDFSAALYKMTAIAKKYEGHPEQLQKTLAELDTVMGSTMTQKEPPQQPPAQTRAPNPMQGSNLTNHKPKGTIKMSRTEADILKKLEQHSGKKIDLKRYAARRDAMQQPKGGR